MESGVAESYNKLDEVLALRPVAGVK